MGCINTLNLEKRSWDNYKPHFSNTPIRRIQKKKGVVTSDTTFVETIINSLSRNVGWGRNVPGYHKLVRTGRLLPYTPFSNTNIVGSSTGAYNAIWEDGSYWSHEFATGPRTYFTDWVLTESAFDAHAPSDIFGYAQNAAAKIQTSGFDALTFITEFRQVPHMFINAARKFIGLKIPKNFRELSNDWLEARYGWRPFINDLKNLNDAIRRINEKTSISRRSARSHGTYTENSEQVLKYLEKTAHFSRYITDRCTISCVGSVCADIEIPEIQFNPIMTAWELIPYSFVVDWFVSVGKVLASLCFLACNTNYTASVGYKVEIERTFRLEVDWYDAHYTTYQCEQTGWCSGSKVYRTPCTVPLTPQLTFKLDTAKVLDLVAMVYQRLGR